MEISNNFLNLDMNIDSSLLDGLEVDEIDIDFNELVGEFLTTDLPEDAEPLAIMADVQKNKSDDEQIETLVQSENGIDIAAGGNMMPIIFENRMEIPEKLADPRDGDAITELSLKEQSVDSDQAMIQSRAIRLTENIEQTEYNPVAARPIMAAENAPTLPLNAVSIGAPELQEDNGDTENFINVSVDKTEFPTKTIANEMQLNNQIKVGDNAAPLKLDSPNLLEKIDFMTPKEFETSTTDPIDSYQAGEISFRQDITEFNMPQLSNDGKAQLNTAVEVSVDSEHWPTQMAEKIHWMSNQDVKSAKIHINPPELGPIEAQIKMLDKGAEIVLSSQHAQIRDAMEQMLPHLKDLFSDNNINLQNVDISDHHPKGQENQQEQNHTREQTHPRESFSTPIVPTAKPKGIVDYYA